MKLLVTFLIVCGFFLCACNAQYLEQIDGYNMWFYKIDEGQIMPEPDRVIKQDTTLTIIWERGDDNTNPYISLYNTTLHILTWVDNTPGLWSGDSTVSPQYISFPQGMYELTITEVDTNNNQSWHSDPVFIDVRAIFARVPFNVQIE